MGVPPIGGTLISLIFSIASLVDDPEYRYRETNSLDLYLELELENLIMVMKLKC